MDPITISAFLGSAGSSLLGGLLGRKAAKTKAAEARASFIVEKSASAIRGQAIEAEAKAAREAAGIEWKAGLIDFDASLIEGQAVTAASASDYFNVLIDAENTAMAFEADATEGEFNARVALQMARNAIEVADAEARDYRLRGNAAIESQAALQAGSGFMLQGSPMLVQDVLFGEVELGAARLKHAGEVEATRLRNESELLTYSATVSTINAKTAREVAKINAGYVKEAGKIRLDAAFLSGDRSLLNLESSLLNARTTELKADYLKIANKSELDAAQIQTAAIAKGAKIEGQAAVVAGIGQAFSTIASSGKFG
jgi:hypothetical protein